MPFSASHEEWLWLRVPIDPMAPSSVVTPVIRMTPRPKHDRNNECYGMLLKGLWNGAKGPARITGRSGPKEAAETNWISSSAWAEKHTENVLSSRPRTPAPQDQEMVNLFP